MPMEPSAWAWGLSGERGALAGADRGVHIFVLSVKLCCSAFLAVWGSHPAHIFGDNIVGRWVVGADALELFSNLNTLLVVYGSKAFLAHPAKHF